MTANQIAYQKVLEEIRSNRTKEQEVARSNQAIEALRRAELEEAQRHNLVSETETNRSNLAKEAETNRSNLAKELEAVRHNQSTEALTAANISATKEVAHAKLAEEARHNVVSEIETSTHNENTERLQDKQIETSKINITSKAAADLALARYKEQQANKRAKAQLETEMKKAVLTSGGRMTSDLMKAIVQYSSTKLGR